MKQSIFSTVKTEGGLFPADFLQRLASPSPDVPGLTPEAYHLAGREKLNEAASRAWNRLLGIWAAFQDATRSIPATEAASGVTREKWLLPLFNELGYGRLQPSRAIELENRTYPVSHSWQNIPIHLVGLNIDLDRHSAGIAGAARISPYGLVQELLNRRHETLWGFVSNGLKLRLLRDNRSLTRQAYVEFDLAAMMDGQAFSDFVVLWLLCHQSRVEGDTPADCWLEKWANAAREQGTRALEELRIGVEHAIESLGRGFLKHPANNALVEELHTGTLVRQDYYRQLLRLVYRLIFLFVAEARDLLLVAKPTSAAAQRYRSYYSISRLRDLAGRRRGTLHGDLWQALLVTMRALSSVTGSPELGLPALGSLLWSDAAISNIGTCQLSNGDLLEAIRGLAFRVERGIRRNVDWRNLGPEELGSVYESLLELHPEVNAAGALFTLRIAAGHERKGTGSYYTPSSLVECLLDSALDPILAKASNTPDPVQAILSLKVCDPAAGSGHFLIAAGHRIARRLAAVRTGDAEASPEAVRHALRDVIGHCLYGVDMNPVAVELLKVNLWLEALEPGRPLSFLDHHIQCGNSLLGATPALLRAGIPDAAFDPIEGDDREFCRDLKRWNKTEREGYQNLFTGEPGQRLGDLAVGMANIDEIDDSNLEGVREKEQRYADIIRSASYEQGHLLADAWCAAFVWPKMRESHPISEELFRKIELNPLAVPESVRNRIRQFAEEYRFFHWHQAFPDVFRVPSPNEPLASGPGWSGGFDLILGNPPWEHVEVKEIEWFSERSPAIAEAPNAAVRKKMIKSLAEEDPGLLNAFLGDLRKVDGERRIMRDSGLYPLCGTGRINTYAVFSELNRTLINPKGHAGFIVPSGIATDDTTKLFFRDLLDRNSLVSLYDFQSGPGIFSAIGHARFKFCLLTIAGAGDETVGTADFAFFLRSVAELNDSERRFSLSADDIALLSPNTRTCPIFRTRRDAELTKAIYRRIPVLWREEPDNNLWDLQFKQGLFNMASASHLFRTAAQLEAEGYRLEGNVFSSPFDRYLPLYEAKMLHQFDHRWSTYRDSDETRDLTIDEKASPTFVVQPRYWVREEIVESAIPHYPEPLHAMLTLENAQGVSLILHLWAAGDAATRGDALLAKRLFEMARLLRADIAITGASGRMDLESLGISLARRFPLTDNDRARLAGDKEKWIDLAREFVARYSPRWLLGWRDITNATNERTLIAGVVPKAAVGDTLLLMFPQISERRLLPALLGNLNSLICDYVARQKLGGIHLKYHVFRQIAVLPPSYYQEAQPWQSPGENFGDWVGARVLELTYTCEDLKAFADDCGWNGLPFPWNPVRRTILRAELDAAFLHAYGLNRHDASYVLSAANFPIVAEKQPTMFDTILRLYDAMALAIRSGVPYYRQASNPSLKNSTI